MEDYIKPIRSYTDKDGTWWIEFKEKDVKEIFENNKDPEVTQGKKPWYKSKTIISNVLASLVCITGLFISDDIESSMYLPASIVSLLNLYLRTVTNSSVQIPMEEKIKRLSKTFLSK